MTKERQYKELLELLNLNLSEGNVVKGKFGDPLARFDVDIETSQFNILPAIVYFNPVTIDLRKVSVAELEVPVVSLIKDLSNMSLDIDYTDSDQLNDTLYINEKSLSLEDAIIEAISISFSNIRKGA